ncbi:MAG TPA: type II toxin-antitoxin system RelE/ParE family toxin [Pyrinomonadaceae bacterium]|jgi:plasmid stabilization system protein ParE|nr:type II toxin-antitoxin system RelE/ParE family toxin [Pyrinomonadaceae bacterium]
MRVLWTDAALGQLEAIRDYHVRTSPEYARRVIERLVKRSEQITSFPHAGRMVPEYEIDEVRQVLESSYRIIYLIKEDRIEVLAIIHTTRRELPQEE